jgi:hypothetical protein
MASNPQIETESTAAADSTTFKFRTRVGSIPYGTASGRLPHQNSDMGGLEDARLSQLTCGSGSIVFLRDISTGDIYRIGPDPPNVQKLDLGFSGAFEWTIDFRRVRFGENIALVGHRARQTSPARFRLLRLNADSGLVSHQIELDPKLTSPATVALMPDGYIWVSEGRQTSIFDGSGKYSGSVPGSGIGLASGVYITAGKEPMCYESTGKPIGKLRYDRAGPLRLLKSGSGDEVLARGALSTLPEGWAQRIEIIDVLRFDRSTLQLSMLDRISVPAPTDDPEHKGRDAPARLHSYFPLEGSDFTEGGNLLLTELTGYGASFYYCQRLNAGESWEAKFRHVDDLNAEERLLARVEWRHRGGVEEVPATYRPFFASLSWSAKKGRRPVEPVDSAMSRLDPQRSKRL